MSIPKLNIIFFRNCDLDLFILSTPSTKSHSVNSTLLSTKITFHFSPNKNKIPQLGHSPISLENLILSILQPFLFIHPRHQCYQLDMGRVDGIDVIATFSEMVVCGNISTVVYVCGNRSIYYLIHS